MVYSSETAKRYGTEITVIKCRFCGEGFDFWEELGEHLSYEHEDEVEKQEVKNQHNEGEHSDLDHPMCPHCKYERKKQPTRSMLAGHYGWEVAPEWLVWLPGLVPGIHLSCAAVGEAGDAVASFTPVYPPFREAPARAGRERIEVPLADAAGTIDLDRLAEALTPRTRLLLLSHPQNPTGRVYRRDELEALATFCLERDLVVCSDEIHYALLLDPDAGHVPLASLGPEVARRTITLIAPSKTYNIAGLGCSLAVIPDPALRKRFEAARAGFVPAVNTLGFTAALAAWRDAGAWHQRLIAYLRGNRERVQAAVDAHPQLAMHPPAATYLAWIDARAIDARNPAPAFEAAGIGPSDGRAFGAPGFVRLNFGCPRATLETGLERLRRVAP